MLDDIEPTTRRLLQVPGRVPHPARSSRAASSAPSRSRRSRPGIGPSPRRSTPRAARTPAPSPHAARSLLITILGDAVHAGKLDRNPAERRKGRRGRKRARGRAPARAAQDSTANVITPLQALCLAERCALLSGRDIDFVMNVFAAWTGVRWGELMAVEGWDGKDSPLQLAENGIATYAVDWQLREIEGVVCKSAPKDGSYRVLDLPPFLADLLRWAMDNRQPHLPLPDRRTDAQPARAHDPTPPNYLFLGPGRRPPAPLELRRPLHHPRRRRPLPSPQRRPPPRLRHRRTLARHPDPPRQPEVQGRRPRGRHLAQPDRQVQAPRRPAHPLHLARSRRPEQGPPDGPPRPRHARHGRRLHPRHPRDAPTPLRRPRTTLATSRHSSLDTVSPLGRTTLGPSPWECRSQQRASAVKGGIPVHGRRASARLDLEPHGH